MIKCPRCNLEQEESALCEYCGLDFSAHPEPAQTAGASATKRVGLWTLLLVICGALLFSYWIFSSRAIPDPKHAMVDRSGSSVQNNQDKDLRKTARELTGDVGMVSEITGGSTKGSIIAMVIFSIVGLAYLSYGKKSQQLLMIICGIGLMGFSYFIDGTVYIILIGLALSALPFVFGRTLN